MSKREKSIYGYFTPTAKKKKNEEVNSGKSVKRRQEKNVLMECEAHKQTVDVISKYHQHKFN